MMVSPLHVIIYTELKVSFVFLRHLATWKNSSDIFPSGKIIRRLYF